MLFIPIYIGKYMMNIKVKSCRDLPIHIVHVILQL